MAAAESSAAKLGDLPQSLKELFGRAALLRFHPDETVFTDDDASDRVHMVATGIVRLCKLLPDGRRAVLGFVHRGGFLNMAAGRFYGCTAEAVTAASLRCCSRRQLDELVDRSPSLQRWRSDLLLEELRAAQARLLLLGRMRAVERVASFLLELLRRSQRDPGNQLQLPMCRLDIADHLGVTHETVSRALGELRQQGVLALPNPQLIVLLRPAALLALAGEEETAGDGFRLRVPASGELPRAFGG